MNCTDCGGLFEPIKGSARPRIRCFGCSPSKAKGLPRKTNKPTVFRRLRQSICAWCSKAFTAKLPHERFCSRRCGTADKNRMKQVAARDRSSRPCKVCGEAFAPAYGDPRRLICSGVCQRRHHAARTAGNTHKRRARRFGGRIESVDRLKVFERDGWQCRMCRVLTPRALVGTTASNAPELDHIKPLSLGGDHAYTNVQCLCRECNAAKGAAATLHEAECRRLARAAKRNGLRPNGPAIWVRDGLDDRLP
jgi:5-methylcytosine-specific restriction endonuclease McrA